MKNIIIIPPNLSLSSPKRTPLSSRQCATRDTSVALQALRLKLEVEFESGLVPPFID